MHTTLDAFGWTLIQTRIGWEVRDRDESLVAEWRTSTGNVYLNADRDFTVLELSAIAQAFEGTPERRWETSLGAAIVYGPPMMRSSAAHFLRVAIRDARGDLAKACAAVGVQRQTYDYWCTVDRDLNKSLKRAVAFWEKKK